MQKGIFPMLPTPFNIDKDIVWEDFTKLIENQISMGERYASIQIEEVLPE